VGRPFALKSGRPCQPLEIALPQKTEAVADAFLIQTNRAKVRENPSSNVLKSGAEPKPPAPLLSNRLIGRLDRVGLHGFSRRSASLAFSGCRLAVARGGEFLLELRLFVGRHRRLFSLRR
jgi:hypothetical protein